MASAAPSPVTPADRLAFTLVVAVLLHALLLFGIRFLPPQVTAAPVLEVTLVPAKSRNAPKRADFLAQANQEGSGTLDQARLLASRQRTPVPGSGEASPRRAQPRPVQAPQPDDSPRLTTRAAAPEQATSRPQPVPPPSPEVAPSDAVDLEIAALEARLSTSRQAYARRPRIRTLSAVSAREDDWAAYIAGFRERVEAVGNAQYPAEARSARLQGEVRLLVALLPSGRVQHISILQSSGYRVLDEAARQSVLQAQPYGSFPPAQQGRVDVLQIIRTWRFAETLDTRL